MKNEHQPLLTTEWTDPVTHAKGYLVIDKLINGLCAGGIRMRRGLEKPEIERLARTMTYKLKTLNMACGGSKAGIAYDASAPDSLDVLSRFLEAHRPFISENWSTSEDLGTKAEDITEICVKMGLKSSFISSVAKTDNSEATHEKSNIVYSLIIDGMPIGDISTGYGVAVSAQKALTLLEKDITKTRVSVQGFGSVGASAALYLSKMGCQIVAVTDAEGTLYNPAGINIEQLIPLRTKFGVIDRTLIADRNYELLHRDKWLEIDAEVLIPAAIADTITAENAHKIKAQLIVEGANIPTTPEAEIILKKQGVHIIPDFIANAGGVGMLGVILDSKVEPTQEGIFGYLEKNIGNTTIKYFKKSLEKGQSVREIALEDFS